MLLVPEQPQAVQQPKRRKSKTFKGVLLFAAAGLIFTTGWGFGSGQISIPGVDARASLSKDLPAALDYSSVNEVYQALKNNFDGTLNADELTDGMKTGLVEAAGDPYTEYMNKQQAQDFNSELSGSFTGIGAELSQDDKGNIIIVSPIAGFPAEKAGLKPKDVIVEIDDKTTAGMTTSEAVTKIRGPQGTTVKLKVVRDGKQELNFTIERAVINIPSVEAKVENGIGYLKISRFGEDTTNLAQQAAADFKKQKVDGVVLDMRGNPGGLLNSAVGVSSLWLPQGTTVLTERRGGEVVDTLKSSGGSPLQGIPTVVLINQGSASASEIVAGALKDNGAATLVGEKTFGKGSVQQVITLRAGGILKVTVARWFTPGGKNIDKEGITPDTTVEITDQQVKDGQDPQKDAAFQSLSQ